MDFAAGYKTFKQMETPKKITLFTKDEVIKLVALFGNAYNTEPLLGATVTTEKAIEEVKDLIDFESIPGNDYVEAFEVYAEDCPLLKDGRYNKILVPAADYVERQ